MTTVIVLLLGLAGVLVTSAIASNPDGSDLSVLGTIQNIWQGHVDFTQNPTDKTAANQAGNDFGAGFKSTLPFFFSTTVANNKAGGPAGNQNYLNAQQG